jgi:hypothetical protein
MHPLGLATFLILYRASKFLKQYLFRAVGLEIWNYTKHPISLHKLGKIRICQQLIIAQVEITNE